MPSSARHSTLLIPHPFPTRRSSDLELKYAFLPVPSGLPITRSSRWASRVSTRTLLRIGPGLRSEDSRARSSARPGFVESALDAWAVRSEEHTSELQSLRHLVCRLLLATLPS